MSIEEKYSHIPNNHLADSLKSKISAVAKSKNYAQITSASWSVPDEPEPSGEVDWNAFSINATTTTSSTLAIGASINTLDSPAVAPFHITFYKDGEVISEGDAEYQSYVIEESQTTVEAYTYSDEVTIEGIVPYSTVLNVEVLSNDETVVTTEVTVMQP